CDRLDRMPLSARLASKRLGQRLFGEVQTEDITFGRFQVIRAVGSGGMSSVYEAIDPKSNRRVALKIIPESTLDPADRHAFSKRLHREGKILEELRHPHIARLYEHGTAQGRYYLALEYIRGQTLRNWIRAGGYRWWNAVDIIIGVAGALHAAHVAGLVHRDIKPSNVMIEDGKEHAKLLDFGIAKTVAEDLNHSNTSTNASTWIRTTPGVCLGTLAYMAPEVLHGATADARSDIFSLSLTLYEAVCGVHPFNGVSPGEYMEALRRQNFHKPRLGHQAPPELLHLCKQGLSLDRSRRYPSVDSLLERLRWIRTKISKNATLMRQDITGQFRTHGH
ncbi:MAG: serine/threonine-protein kinase, partial [Nannocystaceae bacterium]